MQVIRFNPFRFCSTIVNKGCPLAQYKNLRVYQSLSFSQLMNRLLYYQLISSDKLINNFPKLYGNFVIIGRSVINLFLKQSVSPILVGGTTTEDIGVFLKQLPYYGIVSFVGEGVSGQNQEATMDRNAKIFLKSIDSTSPSRKIIAIKISALKTEQQLLRQSKTQNELNSIWTDSSVGSESTSWTNIQTKLQERYRSITEEELLEFHSQILGGQSEISEVDWKTKVHPYYYIDDVNNSNKVIRMINNLTNDELSELRNVALRLNKIIDKARRENCQVLIDSEHSILQPDIESITIQYQTYNTEVQPSLQHQGPIVFSTIQSYFNDSVNRVDFELRKAAKTKEKLAIKLVRGAYLQTEKQRGTQHLSKSMHETNNHYNTNALRLLQSIGKGHLILATQNEESIRQAIANIDQTNKDQVLFAQTLGIADHLSFRLRAEGYHTAKLVMFGDIGQLGGWLQRRALEHRESFKTIENQTNLILDELYKRTMFYS